jgi:hypothetical protein
MIGDAVANLDGGVLTLTVDLRPKQNRPPDRPQPNTPDTPAGPAS